MGDLSVSKKIIFCVFMYNMSYSFALLTAKAWRKNGVEAIDCSGKIWLNQGYLQEKLDIRNISDRTQYHSDEFKKKWDAKYKSVVNINLVEHLLKIL